MHFFGLAIVGHDDDLCELMAPYNENDDRFFTEVNLVDEYADEYENGGTWYFMFGDGNEVAVPSFTGERQKWGPAATCVGERFVPFREKYGSIELYLSDYWGYDALEDGSYVERYNPLAKYDYYRVGGRAFGIVKALKGMRVEPCWEVEEYIKRNGTTIDGLYDEHGYDIAEVDDLIQHEQKAPYFAVLPDGTWLEKDDWNESDETFWENCIKPFVGGGYKVYAIDCHD